MQSISSMGPAPAVGAPSAQSPRSAANPAAASADRPVGGAGHDGSPSAGTPAQLKAAIDAANRQLDQSNHELTFVFDDKLGRMLVKIVDKTTNAVIRQVPSEDMLAAARALSGTPRRGALLNGQA